MLASHSPSLVTFPWKPTSASALKVQTGEDKSQPISVVPLKKNGTECLYRREYKTSQGHVHMQTEL